MLLVESIFRFSCDPTQNEQLIGCVVPCFTVLKPAVDLVCDPHYLNSKLYGWLQYKEHLVAKENRKYLYAETYENFMEMIERCEDIERLKHIRSINQS